MSPFRAALAARGLALVVHLVPLVWLVAEQELFPSGTNAGRATPGVVVLADTRARVETSVIAAWLPAVEREPTPHPEQCVVTQ